MLELSELKEIAINAYLRSGCVGAYRNYYGKNLDVIEWSDWDEFWESWRNLKDILKKNGFGVVPSHGHWIIFCKIEFIEAWMENREPNKKKKANPEELLKKYKENKITKKELINFLKDIIEYDAPQDIGANTELILKSLDIYLNTLGICKNVKDYFEFLIVSATWKRLKCELILMYAFLFPEAAIKKNNCIEHVLSHEENMAFKLSYYHSDELYLLTNFIHDKNLNDIFSKELSWITRRNYLTSFYKKKSKVI